MTSWSLHNLHLYRSNLFSSGSPRTWLLGKVQFIIWDASNSFNIFYLFVCIFLLLHIPLVPFSVLFSIFPSILHKQNHTNTHTEIHRHTHTHTQLHPERHRHTQRTTQKNIHTETLQWRNIHTDTLQWQRKRGEHTGGGVWQIWLPENAAALKWNPVELETGESIADYISYFGIGPCWAHGRINAKLRAISTFIFISLCKAVYLSISTIQSRGHY